tara:strand:+ start:413 stop:565 length:153 start_codon:yes stop_codon:yes gene_type:complete
MDEDFCKGCEKLLPKGVLAKFGGEKVYTLKDGIYCERCAKIKVERNRKNL